MKKVLIAVFISLVMLILAISCKKQSSPSAPGATATTAATAVIADTAVYPFEDGTVMGWANDLAGNLVITSSTAQAHRGTHSIMLTGTFPTSQTGASVTPPSVTNIVGKAIDMWLWVPSDFPGGGAEIFVQSTATMFWQNGPLITITKGGWTRLTYDPLNPAYDTAGADPANITRLGVKIVASALYTGSVYLDSVNVYVVGTPTSTNTPSPTFTATRTPGGPTDSFTMTGTITPTFTITNTPTAAIPDNSIYGWEDGTNMGWTLRAGNITAAVNTTPMAYYGTHSLALTCALVASGSGSIGVNPSLITNITGKSIAARVWIPAGFPTGGGAVYVKTGSGNVYSNGQWLNFSQNSWNTMYLDPSNLGYTGGGANFADIREIGIGIGGYSAGWNGTINIDAVEVFDAPPTYTYTPTPTATGGPVYTATNTPVPTPSNPDDPNIVYYGRWDKSDRTNYRADWGSVYINVNFTGTGVGIKLQDSAFQDAYQYSIDGSAFVELQANTSTVYVLAAGLADTTHSLNFVRRTDNLFGVTNFEGFYAPAGETFSTIAPSPRPLHKIEIIGDSISVGTGDEGVNSNTRYNENGYMAFGPQTARQLNAEWSNIGRGGLGVYHNWNEAAPNAELHAQDYFKRTLYNYAAPLWNFGQWQPDVVIIALGTNDTNSQWDTSPTSLTTAAIAAAYGNLIDYIRIVYPSADIFCMEPIPQWVMQYDGAGTGSSYTGQTYYKTVAQAKIAAGDSKVHYLAVNSSYNSPLLSVSDYEDGTTHPNVSGHTKVANEIAPLIQSAMGW